MTQQYNYIYILVEGEWRYNPNSGILESRNGAWWTDVCLGQRRFMAKEVVGFLNTLQVKSGVQLVYSHNQRETVQVITSLYHWWSDKQWDQHVSHLSPNKAHKGSQGEIMLIKPPLVRRIAAELPLVGWKKSLAVSSHFTSVTQMVSASQKEWEKIPGIGGGIAKGIVKELTKNNF